MSPGSSPGVDTVRREFNPHYVLFHHERSGGIKLRGSLNSIQAVCRPKGRREASALAYRSAYAVVDQA